jgi:group II intron reverse transcriptase/maturase
MAFMAHRIADKRMLRYIKQFLKAGIQEDGEYRASERGTPQGGVISPILANVYLHYSLDLWFTRRFAKTCAGTARLIRYADDFVVCFQTEADAKRFRQEMESRLNQFGLDIAPEKTHCIEFGATAEQRAKERVEKAATFDFLGFTHYCSRSRNGKLYRMKRKTVSKRVTVKLRAYKEWLKENRTLSTPEIMRKTASKLHGHYGYYGVTDNNRGIRGYYQEVRRILLKWLNRRGKRSSYNLEKFAKLLMRYPLPKPRIMVNLF